MIDYVLTGITQTHDFVVYTGTTPVTLTRYGSFVGGTPMVTIREVPYNYKFWVVLEDVVTRHRKSRMVHTPSAYCDLLCDGQFALTVIYAPTPTPSLTASLTPTISFSPTLTPTPSVSTSRLAALTPTPTPTQSVSLTPSVTQTPTLTPTPSPMVQCGTYQIEYDMENRGGVSDTKNYYFNVQYTGCDGVERSRMIKNFSSALICIREVGGSPLMSVDSPQYATITRLSNC
jgi:hypothetical protein